METGRTKGEVREHREADDSSWCLHGYRINVPSLMRGALGILQYGGERFIVFAFVATLRLIFFVEKFNYYRLPKYCALLALNLKSLHNIELGKRKLQRSYSYINKINQMLKSLESLNK